VDSAVTIQNSLPLGDKCIKSFVFTVWHHSRQRFEISDDRFQFEYRAAENVGRQILFGHAV